MDIRAVASFAAITDSTAMNVLVPAHMSQRLPRHAARRALLGHRLHSFNFSWQSSVIFPKSLLQFTLISQFLAKTLTATLENVLPAAEVAGVEEHWPNRTPHIPPESSRHKHSVGEGEVLSHTPFLTERVLRWVVFRAPGWRDKTSPGRTCSVQPTNRTLRSHYLFFTWRWWKLA